MLSGQKPVELVMDVIWLALFALLWLLTVGMALGCARLGGGRS